MTQLLEAVQSVVRSEVSDSDVVSFSELEFEEVAEEYYGNEVSVIIIRVSDEDAWARVMDPEYLRTTLEVVAKEAAGSLERQLDEEEAGGNTLFEY